MDKRRRRAQSATTNYAHVRGSCMWVGGVFFWGRHDPGTLVVLF